MHLNWHVIQVVGLAVLGFAAATCIGYMPDPKPTDPWYYTALWHILQFLAANLAKNQTVLAKKIDSDQALKP
jgi:hypothetical protein